MGSNETKVETFPAVADEYREGLRRQIGLSPAQLESLRNSKLAALERELDPDGSKMDVACGRLLDAVEAAPIPPLPIVNKPVMADKIAEVMGEVDEHDAGSPA